MTIIFKKKIKKTWKKKILKKNSIGVGHPSVNRPAVRVCKVQTERFGCCGAWLLGRLKFCEDTPRWPLAHKSEVSGLQ